MVCEIRDPPRGATTPGDQGALKVIAAVAESPPLALPALTSQVFGSDDDVPHVPLPTVPVTTLKLVDGSDPVAVIVTGVAVAMSQLLSPLALVRHSTTYTWSLALNPEPDTVTDSPLVRLVLGLTLSCGDDVPEDGVTLLDALERGLAPTEFLATTVNVYAVPLVSPEPCTWSPWSCRSCWTGET